MSTYSLDAVYIGRHAGGGYTYTASIKPKVEGSGSVCSIRLDADGNVESITMDRPWYPASLRAALASCDHQFHEARKEKT